MRDRVRDYTLLLVICAVVTLPNLGDCSLWDVDEGVNAQAAREMRDANTWVIPTFNYELRTAKPVMLYWLQRASYAAFGVNEWSARFPSVIVSWITVLLTYELARRMFGRAIGLLSGTVLASVVLFAVLSHAATPDATLLVFTLLTYLAFWVGHENGSRSWWVPTAAACGLAMLTKGPIGVALPGLVLLMYFAWNRELGRLIDRKFFAAAGTFILVAVPWYALVASETRGEWLRAFFAKENVHRFLSPMEGHHGGIWLHSLLVFVLFAPWSVFLCGALWYAVKGSRSDSATNAASVSSPVRAGRLLICWAFVYLAFFSVAATKLPNYVYPIYPPLAIITGWFLISWRDGTVAMPRWLMPTGVAGLVITAVVVAGGIVYAEREFPGIQPWATLGLLPLTAAAAMTWHMRRGDRNGAIVSMAVVSVVFIALMIAFPTLIIDRQKAPRELVRAGELADASRDIRVAAFEWFQPSIVFYSGREVARLRSPEALEQFLAVPTPGYVFVAAPTWERVTQQRVQLEARVVARHRDFLNSCDILLISNTPGSDVAAR